VIAHNVAAAAVVTLLAYALSQRRWLTAMLACISFHSHILGDVIGARGRDRAGRCVLSGVAPRLLTAGVLLAPRGRCIDRHAA
jgi:hypothetical protein